MFETTALDTRNPQQILTVIIEIKLLLKSSLVCCDTNEKQVNSLYSFTSFIDLVCITCNLGVSIAYFSSLKARNSVNFQQICKILVCFSNCFKMLGKRLSFHEPAPGGVGVT